MTTRSRTVAVVGSGVAGLTAAHLLQRTAEVTLYEADDRLGGHAHTHDVRTGDRSVPVDSGFIVHNRRTYPLLCRLFEELGVETRPTEMSMSVRCLGCGLEYCGARGASGLFARGANAADPRFWGLLAQVPRFHARARRLLADSASGPAPEPTLGEFLAAGRFTPYFVNHFVIPLVSAVWSCGPHLVPEYPARYLFAFLDNHGMLTVTGSPTWRTVTGGSRTYVERIAKRLTAVRTSAPVASVQRHEDTVTVALASGEVNEHDAVVVATHPDQALRLLADPTPAEKAVLGAFEYSRNPAVLHTDPGPLPRRERARGSWNYLLPSCRPGPGAVQVSYDLRRLQGLDTDADVVATLGDTQRIDPGRVVASTVYEHPVYTPAALAAQDRLGELDTGRTAFAGAYHGWGFHEDGCRAGAAAAASLGAPW
ncbi:FAD-dependent oxidoreductase [Glycomyces sp. A-F 0318]|uniref:NAD(P)/FAD-dependent oxidoreductase n=1 Tax=Glycomyces amatae TaxID=2881355 RepID=UPI001E39F542|nr:FAD-dependent oxidoreductase [Glycomyces amatae]MCD0447478.1 FAD-dependent oxidoreductase [Glycomyces amatae]